MALVVKNPPANAGDTRDSGLVPELGRFPGGGHSNPVQWSSWRIPWTEESGGPQPMGSQRVVHNWRDSSCHSKTTYQVSYGRESYFLTILQAGKSRIKVLTNLVSCTCSLPGLQMTPFRLRPHMAFPPCVQVDISFPLFIKLPILSDQERILWLHLPIISYLLKALSPNRVTVEVKASTYAFVEDIIKFSS